MADDRTGLLIIRAWIEHGSSEPLLAQVRHSTDVSVGMERTVNLVRADDVGATVKEWLSDMMSDEECLPEPAAT